MAGAGRLDQAGTQTAAGKTPAKPACTRRTTAPRIGSCYKWGKQGLWASTRKIKLLKQGYRLVYAVEDGELVVLVLSVGKRANSVAYLAAAKRIK